MQLHNIRWIGRYIMGKPLKVLIVDDSENDAFLLVYELKKGGFQPEWILVETENDLCEALRTGTWDVVTSDHSMPRFSAPEALAAVQRLCPDLPVIIVSGEIDITLAVGLMKAGAREYVQKHDLARLPLVIERELKDAATEKERQQMAADLRKAENQYRFILENITDVVYTLNREGCFDYISPVAWDFAGYSVEAFSGTHFSRFVHPDDIDKVARNLQKSMEGQDTETEFRIFTNTGDLMYIRASCRPILDSGTVTGVAGVLVDISESMQIRQALMESEAKYRRLISGIKDVVFSLDCTSRFTYISPVFKEIAGFEISEVIGREFAHFIYPPDLPAMREFFKNTLGGREEGATFRVVDKYGEIRWVHSSSRVSHRGEEVIGISGIITDVTEKQRLEIETKEALEALRQNEARYQQLFETAGDAYVCFDIEGNILDCNRQFEEMLGYPHEELTGLRNQEITPATWLDYEARIMLEQIVGSGYSDFYEKEYTRKDGRIIPVELKTLVTCDSEGRPSRMWAIVRDTSERNALKAATLKALQDLRASEEMHGKLLQNVLDSMPSLLVSVDAEGRVTQWNHEAENQTGTKRDGALGRFIEELLPDFKNLQEQISLSIRSKQVQYQHKVALPCAIPYRLGDIVIYPLVANGIDGAVVRIDDITERVAMEEMIIHSEKMLSLGGLAAGMAHEINNPLGGIIQGSQNIMRRLSLDFPANIEAAQDLGTSLEIIRSYMKERNILPFLEGIQECSVRAANIVQNMLRFARRSDTVKTSHDLHSLIDKSLQLAASDYDLRKQYDFKHIQIEKQYEQATLPVPCIENEIEQVLLNIFKNAAQAMSEADRSPCLRIETRIEGNNAVLTVSDNGPGMSQETISRVFEPFFTTKPAGLGTGLGLSVANFIILEDHAGSMAVDSEPGLGTRFTIKLPR